MNLKFLIIPILLFCAHVVRAQTPDSTSRAFFEYVKGVKCINIDGTIYKPISPSIFVAKGDTIEKLQHPLHGKPAIQRPDYVLIAIIWEPLAFKNSECTSKQIVDLYRKKKMTKKDAPETLVITKFKRDTVYDWCVDSVFIDTSKIVYKMPVDTGGVFVLIGGRFEVNKYFGKKSSPAFKITNQAILWNGTKSANPADTMPLLENWRVTWKNEFGIERARTGYFVTDDSCLICAEEQKLYRLVGETALGVQFAPRRPLGDKKFQPSGFFEVRYKYLGKPDGLPNFNGWNRFSLNLGTRADYGPFIGEICLRWTPGLGLGWNAGINYNFVHWAPKKGSKMAKLKMPTWNL